MLSIIVINIALIRTWIKFSEKKIIIKRTQVWVENLHLMQRDVQLSNWIGHQFKDTGKCYDPTRYWITLYSIYASLDTL